MGNAFQPPFISGLFMVIPGKQRIAPELPGCGKGIGRTACHTGGKIIFSYLE